MGKLQEQGASAEPTGLSPTVEPAGSLDGSATSIPSAWTPGPWGVDDYNCIRADRPNDADCVKVAEYSCSPLGLDFGKERTRPLDNKEAEANARLIAAAPEMAEALRELCQRFDTIDGEPFVHPADSPWAKAWQLLAKIGGEA